MTENKSNITSKVMEEHNILRENISTLSSKIEMEIPDEKYEEWRLEFMWQLRDFRNHCLKHFDFEELGGFMKDVLNEAPETKNIVIKLEDEHTKIIKELDKILDDLKSLEQRDAEKLEQLRSNVKHLIIKLKAHEKAENDLIQKVYSQEYGYPGG
jgi:hemerythrin-like domain-containing protein